MKPNQLISLIAIVATMLFATACGEETTEETPTTETAPEAEEQTAPTPEPAQPAQPAQPAAGGGGSVCERAQTCCEAYVQEMNAMNPAGGMTAEQTCAGIAAARQMGGPTADTTCQSTIDGFRTGLTAAQRTVPASCAAQ